MDLEGVDVTANAMAERVKSLLDDGLLSINEACKFLGLSRSTLYKLMDSGDLQYCQIGGTRRLPRRALVELAARFLVK
jgi:excisionase family DNA binding protein